MDDVDSEQELDCAGKSGRTQYEDLDTVETLI